MWVSCVCCVSVCGMTVRVADSIECVNSKAAHPHTQFAFRNSVQSFDVVGMNPLAYGRLYRSSTFVDVHIESFSESFSRLFGQCLTVAHVRIHRTELLHVAICTTYDDTHRVESIELSTMFPMHIG